MNIEGIVGGVGRIGRAVADRGRVYALGLGMAIGTAGFASDARAETIDVDPSWTPQEINNILDGEPGTVGKGGQTDAQAGDTVHFGEGVYQLGLGEFFENRISNVVIEGEGAGTVFRGDNQIDDVPVWKNVTDVATYRNFKTENSLWGIKISPEASFQEIVLSGLVTTGHVKHILFDEQDADEPTTQPSIILEDCLLDGDGVAGTGVHYSWINTFANPNTKYVGVRSTTMNGLGLGIDAPIYWDNGWVVKGNDDFVDNIYVNGVQPFYEEIYPGFHTPMGHIEAENTGASLEAREIQPENDTPNREYTMGDLKLDSVTGRPLPGSPLIGPQFTKGYCGALAPYENFVRADVDGDGDVDQSDFGVLQRCFSGYNSMDYTCKSLDLAGGNGKIDQADFEAFERCASGPGVAVDVSCDD